VSIVSARSSPEYLIALSIRFASACPTASASIATSGRSAATRTSTLNPCWASGYANASSVVRMSGSTAVGVIE